jgi:hypothetical protein
MSVTVDDEPLATDSMGFKTVGQVLTHLQRGNRLVVNLLIDGHAPDLSVMPQLRGSPLNGHTVYIETVEPRAMALGVIDDVQEQLSETDAMREQSVDLLSKNQVGKAMEKLSGCFSVWHAAQEAVQKVAQLLRLDLDRVSVGSASLASVMADFAEQLRQIRGAIERRDFVTLSDILSYEADQTSNRWRDALLAVRATVGTL